MAALSPAPAPRNTITTTPTKISIIKPNSPSSSLQDDPPKFSRGQNKPRCSICGNVARSKCRFFSCKKCCAEAENPCEIHVLKLSKTLPDKKQSSTDQKSTDESPPGTTSRAFSYWKQLHGTPSATRKLTGKEAAALNRWRFSKVKEYNERNMEVENEALDRYMGNVSLLEEVFSVNSRDDGPAPISDETSAALGPDPMILELKAHIRSNYRKADNLKKRMQYIVDEGLSKLRKLDSNEVRDLDRSKKTERALAMDELIKKLNKARDSGASEISKEQSYEDATKQLVPRLWSRVEIHEDTLHKIDTHFSSLDQIEDL
ncbi:hypothetical protein ACHQM5_007494 [Ranunculus cassubicifolius]